jgi:hypothetical protein
MAGSGEVVKMLNAGTNTEDAGAESGTSLFPA